MLLELRIRNFAIIEEAALQFGAGLNVLSGETGAGKTIIMSALAMLLGARASADVIRVDQKEAAVEALFELEGEAPSPEGIAGGGERELLIRRVIAAGGRSRVTHQRRAGDREQSRETGRGAGAGLRPARGASRCCGRKAISRSSTATPA